MIFFMQTSVQINYNLWWNQISLQHPEREITAKEGALEMAEAGLPVFPIWGVRVQDDGLVIDLKTGLEASHGQGSGKKPKTRGSWKDEATTDSETILRWFEEDPEINYGVVLGNGWFVVDFDSLEADEETGLSTYDELMQFTEQYWSDRFHRQMADEGITDFTQEITWTGPAGMTFTVNTAQGVHVYYRGTSSSGRKPEMQKVDFKGEGGYVVGPGSVRWDGGRYVPLGHPRDTQPCPPWLPYIKRGSSASRSVSEGSSRDTGFDLTWFSAEGHRNNRLTTLLGALVKLGMTQEASGQIVAWVNQEAGNPISDEELRETVLQYKTWEPGHILEIEAATAAFIANAGRKNDDENEPFVLDYLARKRKKPRTWLYEGLIPETGIGQIVGASYTGKSFLAVDLGMRFANGMPWMGKELQRSGVIVDDLEREKDLCLYVMAEGAWDFNDRIAAWLEKNGGSDRNLLTVEEKPVELSDLEGWVSLYARMSEAMSEEDIARIGLVILDTQSLLLYKSEENSNDRMSAAMRAAKQAKDAFGCPVVFVHHTGHAATRGRGASAVYAAMDFVMVIGRPEGQETGTLTFTKMKGATLPPTTFYQLRAQGPSAVWTPTLAPQRAGAVNDIIRGHGGVHEAEDTAHEFNDTTRYRALHHYRDFILETVREAGDEGIKLVDLMQKINERVVERGIAPYKTDPQYMSSGKGNFKEWLETHHEFTYEKANPTAPWFVFEGRLV